MFRITSSSLRLGSWLCAALLLGACSSGGSTEKQTCFELDGAVTDCGACPGCLDPDVCPTCQPGDGHSGCPDVVGTQDVAPCDLGCTAPDCAQADLTPLDPQAFCELLQVDRTAQNLASIHGFAWAHAQAIIHGTFGATRQTVNGKYASFTVDSVPFGWSFLAGITVLIPLPDEYPGGLQDTTWTLALSGSYPVQWSDVETPVWGNLLAIIPDSTAHSFGAELAAPRYAEWMAAEVRILEQDEHRTKFEVVDVLKGEFPPVFADNWYFEWNLPYPAPGPETWLVTLAGGNEYPDGEGKIWLGSVLDFQPATPAAKADLLNVLALAPAQGVVNPTKTQAAQYKDSYRFFTSPMVVSSVVTGLAMECCTGAGGTYVAHEVVKALKGELSSPQFVVGGHAYYGEEQCGDGYLVGLADYLDPTSLITQPFDCKSYPDTQSWDAWVPLESALTIQVRQTPQSLSQVTTWMQASHPVYLLHPEEAELDDSDASQDPSNAPWSMPLDADLAFRHATDVAIFTVEEVLWDSETELHTVWITTTFSTWEAEHMPVYRFKLIFRCGDPRLLQKGARWVGGLHRPDHGSPPDQGANIGKCFLVPGALLPVWAFTSQLENTLGTGW